MADRLELGDFEVDRSGVVEILKGGAVRGLVASHTGRLARSANAAAAAHRESMPHGTRKALERLGGGAPYEGAVKAGRFDTLGVVRTASAEGAYDSNQHHTLDNLV